jgi:nickel/cobalt exporter
VRRRLAVVLGVAAALFAGAGLFVAPAALAHPLGNFTVNRYSGLVLTPGHIQLTYVLDMAEIPTHQELYAIDANGDGIETEAEMQGWADAKTPELLSHVGLTVGGRPVALRMEGHSMRFRSGQAGLPVLYLVATFEGPLPPSGAVAYNDGNYAGRAGWAEITVASRSGVAIIGSPVPAQSISHELTAYPLDMLASPLKVGSVGFSFHPGAASSRPGAAHSGPTVSGAPVSSGAGFAGLINRHLTPMVLGLALALAFGFGAIHALGPGHGKTITAAYLVGSEARTRTAIVAGVAVALMHTVSVLALGFVALELLRSFPTDRVYPWLALVTGVVAFGLGAALLVVRVAARRRGEDAWGVHTHTHAHANGHLRNEEHGPLREPARELVLVGASAGWGQPTTSVSTWDHDQDDASGDDGYLEIGHHRDQSLEHLRMPPPDRPRSIGTHRHSGPDGVRIASRRGLMALAVAGGILPSPTAIVVLTGAISYHRIGYGLALIVAFSFGLASALVAVGLLALRVRSAVSRRLGGRVGALVPLASAAMIMGVGVFFLLRGVAQVG